MMIQTSLSLSPDILGTGFARTRYFVATGRGYIPNSAFEPTSILIFPVDEETYQPLTIAQIQDVAEKSLRNDLKQHFGNYLFNVELFHLCPLPVPYTGSIFVSCYAYTDRHRLRISKTFPVTNVQSWESTMDQVLDIVEEQAKIELSAFGSLDGYGVDWLTFTPQDR